MKLDHPLHFNGFRLDPLSARLTRDKRSIPLTPKAFALLSYLAQRPGQLVTKEQLLQTVWADTLVSDAAVTVCIREIRKALGDNARKPRFVETVHRRGYRFIAPVVPIAPAAPDASRARSLEPGINAELAELPKCLAHEQEGEQEVVFVTGEAASGKAALVQAVVHPAAQDGFWMGTNKRPPDSAELAG
jgi:DNA-binding winged helix-turn-helix (wHTH) protein